MSDLTQRLRHTGQSIHPAGYNAIASRPGPILKKLNVSHRFCAINYLKLP